MKLHLIDRTSKENSSWTIRKNIGHHFLKLWHYHPELELVLILKSTGIKFIGDSIEQFKENDLILIGENLPHMWLSDQEYFEKDTDLISEAIAIHFKTDFLGKEFLLHHIAALLERARYGIRFFNIDQETLKSLTGLPKEAAFERTIKLIRILDQLARHGSFKLLASEGYLHTLKHTDHKYLDKIYAYIFNNFKEPINLETAAQIAGMNPTAFSRSFKRIKQKTFSRFVNEIRIGYACKLLIENKLNITTICFESGFNNVPLLAQA